MAISRLILFPLLLFFLGLTMAHGETEFLDADADPAPLLEPGPPELPSAEGIALKTLVLPSWGAYASGNGRLATLFALTEVGLLRVAYEAFQEYGASPETNTILGLALVTTRLVGLFANHSQALSNIRSGSFPSRRHPRTHRLGLSLSAGQYTGASGYGLSLDLGRVRLSARTGGLMPNYDYRFQSEGAGRLHERLRFDGAHAFGIEGVWRMNTLVRVQPGMQFILGRAVRETYQEPGLGWGRSIRVGRTRDAWVQAMPTLTLAFDAFDPVALSTGFGYELRRPRQDAAFYEAMEREESWDRDEAPDRLRFHLEIEWRFL